MDLQKLQSDLVMSKEAVALERAEADRRGQQDGSGGKGACASVHGSLKSDPGLQQDVHTKSALFYRS